MITQLRFKNWRSLKDVTIPDLQPINVFIGANSSGKTNILDAIKSERDSLVKGIVQVVQEQGYRRIKTDAFHNRKNVVLTFTYRIPKYDKPITKEIILKFQTKNFPFKYGTRLYEDGSLLEETKLHDLPISDGHFATFAYGGQSEEGLRIERARKISNIIENIISRRWQLLGDSFVPALRLSQNEGGDPYVIEPDSHNFLII